MLRAVEIHEFGPGKSAAPCHERIDVQFTCKNLLSSHSRSTAHHGQFSICALCSRNCKCLYGEVQSFPLQYSTCEEKPKWLSRSAHRGRRFWPDINAKPEMYQGLFVPSRRQRLLGFSRSREDYCGCPTCW